MSTAPEDIITPELRRWVGMEAQLGIEVVEAGAIRRFADAIKDPNPLYRDEEYARNTPYGGIVAPPTFIHALRSIGYSSINPGPMPWKNTTVLNGGNDFEYLEPIRPGDIITGKVKLVEISARQTKQLGPMIITVAEMTYTNQNGEVVAKQRSIGLTYEAQEPSTP